jgi:hypothetical protein
LKGAELLTLLLALSGCERINLARWPAAMQRPDSVEAHLVGMEVFSPNDVSAGGVVFERWVDRAQLKLSVPQQERVRQLLADSDAISGKSREPTLCLFNADLALVWTRGTDRVWAVFCLTCGETRGNSGIQSFDIQRIGQLGATLFPAQESFQRAAAGKSPHGSD